MRTQTELKPLVWLAKQSGKGGGKSFSKDGKDGKDDALAPLLCMGKLKLW